MVPSGSSPFRVSTSAFWPTCITRFLWVTATGLVSKSENASAVVLWPIVDISSLPIIRSRAASLVIVLRTHVPSADIWGQSSNASGNM